MFLPTQVLMTNMTYSDVTTILNPSSMTAKTDVILPAAMKINGVDLGVDALTFRPDDEKTFINPVKIIGGLKVVPGSAKDKNLSLSSSHGVVLVDESDVTSKLYSVNLPER